MTSFSLGCKGSDFSPCAFPVRRCEDIEESDSPALLRCWHRLSKYGGGRFCSFHGKAPEAGCADGCVSSPFSAGPYGLLQVSLLGDQPEMRAASSKTALLTSKLSIWEMRLKNAIPQSQPSAFGSWWEEDFLRKPSENRMDLLSSLPVSGCPPIWKEVEYSPALTEHRVPYSKRSWLSSNSGVFVCLFLVLQPCWVKR